MRRILFFIVCLFLNISFTFGTEIIEVRKMYYDAATKKDASELFLTSMKNIKVESNPLLLCYRGMAYMIGAKYSFNPYTKLSYFNKGKEMLEKAVKAEPENVEIRFMRYCIQTNAPFFLNYSSNADVDKTIILKSWATINDIDLKLKIKNYMLQSASCTQIEKSVFK